MANINTHTHTHTHTHTESLSLCGHPSIEFRSTSAGKICSCLPKRSLNTFDIGMSLLVSHLLKLWTTICSPRGVGPDLQKASLKCRWSQEHLSPATAGLSVPCVLGLSPAGSSSSVHGRGCWKKRHPSIESLKQSLRKAAADFLVDVFRNSIDGWPQRLKDCVRANGKVMCT